MLGLFGGGEAHAQVRDEFAIDHMGVRRDDAGADEEPGSDEPSPVIMAIDGSDSAAISAEESGRPGSARRAGEAAVAPAWPAIRGAAGWVAGGGTGPSCAGIRGRAGFGFAAITAACWRGTSRPRASA